MRTCALIATVLALTGCHRAAPAAVDAGLLHPRSAPVPVQLPQSFDGYVALRGDDAALAQGHYSDGAGTVVLRALDQSGKVLFSATLDTPAEVEKTKGFLVREGYRPLTEHPADAYVDTEVKLSLRGESIIVSLGQLTLSAPAPFAAGKDAQLELAGWSVDGKVLVVRMRATRGEFGAATGYVIVPVPNP
jgi:hypothetical protein